MSLSGNRNVIPEGYDLGRLQQFTPQQQQLFGQLFDNLGADSYTQRLARGDQSAFREREAPALDQFAQLQGNLANRFAGMGTGGTRSSGFQVAQNQSAQDFASQLQSQRQDLMRQAQQDLFGMSQQLLGMSPYDQFLIKKQYEEEGPNFLEKLLGGIAPVAGAGIGAFFGGIPGAKVGLNAGSAFGQAFQ